MFNEVIKIVILLVVTIFPFLIYITLLEGKKNINKNEDYLNLELSIFSSQFLLIETMMQFKNYNYIIITLIPCLISLFKKHYVSSFILFLIILLNLHINDMFSLVFVIIFGTVFLLTTVCYLSSSMTKNKFVNILSSLELILYIIYFIFFVPKEYKIIDNYLIHVTCFFLSLKIGCMLFIKLYSTARIRKNLRDLKQNKELKDSLFKITHEIKNPIAVVNGYLSMFDINNKDKSIRYIEIIKKEIERVLNLLHDFLSMKIINLNKETVDLTILFDEINDILLPLFESKKITCIYNIKSNIKTQLDYNRIKQVLINLIKNSIEASDKYSMIKINVTSLNKRIIISIKDNGIGMNKETKEYISSKTPFYTTKSNGTGLGICLSREIIEAHGGRITFSSSLGKGTTFKIYLPLKKRT